MEVALGAWLPDADNLVFEPIVDSDLALLMVRDFRPGALARCMVTTNSVELVFGQPPLEKVVPVLST